MCLCVRVCVVCKCACACVTVRARMCVCVHARGWGEGADIRYVHQKMEFCQLRSIRGYSREERNVQNCILVLSIAFLSFLGWGGVNRYVNLSQC